jgi:hypothetical protein
MPPWVSLFFICLLTSVQAAFTGRTCTIDSTRCVQQTSSGTVCLSSNISASFWTCPAPFNLPLETHLTQNYSIGYYNAAGRFLGGWNLSIPTPPSVPTYVCLSTRVNLTSEEYYTLCAQAEGNDQWSAGGCSVNLAPPNVVDGCYVRIVSAFHCSYVFCPRTHNFFFSEAIYYDDH